MKSLILVLMLAIIPVFGNAQSRSSLIYGQAVEKYRKMEIAGTVVTVIGGITLFTGNIIYWKSYNGKTDADIPGNKVKSSRNMMLAGLGIMAVGIPVWAVAKSKERHISIEAELVKFKGYASANGIGLRIRF